MSPVPMKMIRIRGSENPHLRSCAALGHPGGDHVRRGDLACADGIAARRARVLVQFLVREHEEQALAHRLGAATALAIQRRRAKFVELPGAHKPSSMMVWRMSKATFTGGC